MRKLKLQMQMSIDGFTSTGPNDEQKWVTWAWDEINQYVMELARSADTEIIGRKLAVDYIPYWQKTSSKPDDPMYQLSQIKKGQQKVVFTNTLEDSKWDNTVIAKGNLIEEVTKLKRKQGKDIIVYGGSSFVSNLIKENLIDEFHLFVNPVALGKGVALFNQLDHWKRLNLQKSITCRSGIIIQHYNLM